MQPAFQHEHPSAPFSKGSPPRRAALHERSDSQTNERASPTLRIIGDPQAPIYESNPFPTKPYQILSPGFNDGQGLTLGPRVGALRSRESQSEIENDIEEPLSTAALHTQHRSRGADATDAFHTPTQGNTSTSFLAMDEGIENNFSRLSDDIVQLPSIAPGFESSEPYRTANRMDAPRPPVSKDSDGSLSSSNSTGTVIVKRHRDGRKRASYSAFPSTARPGSSKSNLSSSTPQKLATEDAGDEYSPVSPISPSPLITPNNAITHERRVSSVPLYAKMHVSSQDSVNLQYPIIRPPSASASWYVHFRVNTLVIDCGILAAKALRSMKPTLLPGSLSSLGISVIVHPYCWGD